MDQAAGHEDDFVVAYTGAKIHYLMRRAVPVFLFFCVLLAAYMNDAGRRLFHAGRDVPWDPVAVGVLSVLVLVPILDMALTLAIFQRGRSALVVDAAGVEGAILYRAQRIAWEKIAHVFIDGPDFVIERKPRDLVETFFVQYSRPGSRHRITQTLRIPLRCVDKSAADIEAAIRSSAPAGFWDGLQSRAKTTADHGPAPRGEAGWC